MLTQKGHGCDEHITSLGHNWNCVRIRTRALQVKNIAFYSELIFFEIISWLATNNKNNCFLNSTNIYFWYGTFLLADILI